MTESTHSGQQLDPAFVEKLYEEVMALVHETATYLGVIGANDKASLSEDVQATFSGESLRLTTQLLQVVSWLLAQRAVGAAEITMEEALSPSRRLGGQDVCLGDPLPESGSLPDTLVSLLDRSRHLYQRVERLELQLLEGEPPHNPLDELRDRLNRP